MSDKQAKAAGVGGVGAAMLASVCCIGPVVATVLGLGSAGFAAALEPWRPVFLGATVVALGFGFFQAYRPRPKCEDGSCEKPRSVRGLRAMMWVATVLATLSLGFPYYSGVLFGVADAQEGAPAPGVSTCTMKVEGMTCAGCEVHVTSVLSELPGVKTASANSDKGAATVQFDPAAADLASFSKVVEAKTPYKASACESATTKR